ncbi:MAG: phage holin family protein [Novosphingobium sp.]|nr:phage holin family protein [Novosphingobium sp.]
MDEGNHGTGDRLNRSGGGQEQTLFDDVAALIDDGRTMVEAELAYQKTRLAYAGRHGRNAAILGVLAAVLAVFALFGLVMGAIWALTPLLTAWGATAAVVAALLIVAGLCALFAARNARKVANAFREDD